MVATARPAADLRRPTAFGTAADRGDTAGNNFIGTFRRFG
jgi:hypothetical protein